jgi:hypothetical protein
VHMHIYAFTDVSMAKSEVKVKMEPWASFRLAFRLAKTRLTDSC